MEKKVWKGDEEANGNKPPPKKSLLPVLYISAKNK